MIGELLLTCACVSFLLGWRTADIDDGAENILSRGDIGDNGGREKVIGLLPEDTCCDDDEASGTRLDDAW